MSRPKGVKNKIRDAQALREPVIDSSTMSAGWEYLAALARHDPKNYVALLKTNIPTEAKADVNSSLTIQVVKRMNDVGRLPLGQNRSWPLSL